MLLQEIILPKTGKPMVVFSGSHDLALEEIAEHLQKHILLFNLPVGSLDGLVNLRQGLCQISGSHLARRKRRVQPAICKAPFPDREMEIFTLAHRTRDSWWRTETPKA